VMLSASAMPATIEQLRAAGARDYLTKPLDVKRFLQVVDEILASTTQPGPARPGSVA
jgi:CheY-like chemotaxis protein